MTMRILWLGMRAFCALLLFLAGTAAPACAQPGDPAGRWAVRAEGRTLMLLDLVRDRSAPGGWSGSLTRPERLGIMPRGAFIAISGPIAARPVVAAAQRGAATELALARPDGGAPDRYLFRLIAADVAELVSAGSTGPALLLTRAAAGDSVAPDWEESRIYSADWRWPSNPEMKAMFEADQGARQNPVEIDWDTVSRQDEERRRRTRALLEAGELRSGEDFYRAAFIFQHGGEPDSYLLAHVLAMVALQRGHAEAGWIAAATLDRYLHRTGRPQIFGTQYSSPPGQPTTQEPYDRALLPDSLRFLVGVPNQAEQEAQRLQFEAEARERERRQPPPPPSPPR
ncbi:hypothetical protein [Allosphingosinicella sp.]|jgi:hypothetical protein|uniref:hypothetical protein n=1 Tax=Allosphingosinicella sp. TaxID=2823234 RepID=UPI002F127572